MNQKAAPIMKIIQDIFSLILKFCSQLASAAWGQDSGTGEVTHPNFAAMVTSFKAFKEYFAFLFKGGLMWRWACVGIVTVKVSKSCVLARH